MEHLELVFIRLQTILIDEPKGLFYKFAVVCRDPHIHAIAKHEFQVLKKSAVNPRHALVCNLRGLHVNPFAKPEI